MSAVLLPFPASRTLAHAIAGNMSARVGVVEWRRFPDGESLVTIDEDLAGADVAIVATLRDPDTLALALRFAAATAREFGARSVGLIAPYLGYMRQDTRFQPGQAISAPLFASFLEQTFDWLVTVDPHLHRIAELGSLFAIPTRHVRAADAVASWIRREIPDSILIGPDVESRQWVQDIAARAGVPYQVLEKQRRGDRDVSVSLPDANAARGHVPVVIDDIVSSGRTLIETLGHLQELGLPPATCIAIHAVFSEGAYGQLMAAGAARVVSTDTIPHSSNAIPLASALAAAAGELMGSDVPGRNARS